jgi:hypothetical protein
MRTKKKKVLRIIVASIVAFCIILAGGFYIYTLDYYRAEVTAATAISANDNSIEIKNGMTVFYPKTENDMKTALIFYPGGKVEAAAYTPLLKKLTQEGLTCILVKMPFNLAVFGINSADSVYRQLPDIKVWYIGGHSLGGAMASSYVEQNSDKLNGLILLGAYPVNASNLPTLVVYGSEDNKLDKSKLSGVKNVVEISGGNHAQFGNYGIQKGDGTATVTREEQQALAVDAIMTFISQTRIDKKCFEKNEL